MCDLNLTGVEKLHKPFLLRVLRLARATACAPGHCQRIVRYAKCFGGSRFLSLPLQVGVKPFEPESQLAKTLWTILKKTCNLYTDTVFIF